MSATSAVARRGWLSALDGLTSPRAAYVGRTLLAMAVAIYLAFRLQLSSPGSAAVTVMIVANQSRGAILSKGLWRILGTLAGAAAAVVMMAAFPQSPLLFLLAFGIWLGLCTFVSGMFRHFRSYAAVLSGYTVALVAFAAVSQPEHILGFALSRLAVVTLGVVVSTVTTMIFQPSITSDAMRMRGRGAVRGVARLIRDRAAGMDDAAFNAERSRLAGEIEGLDEVIEFAGAEDFDVRRHAPSLRRGLAALYGALMSIPSADRSRAHLFLAEAAPERHAAALVRRMEAAFARVAALDVLSAQDLTRQTDEIGALLASVAEADDRSLSTAEVTALVGLQQELRQIHDMMAAFAAWRAGRAPYHGSGRLSAFADYATSLRNAVRAMIAVTLGGLFWYVTAWPAGGQLMVILGSVCALLSAAPSAAAASLEFGKGIVLSSFVAFPVFLLLPDVSGYPILFLMMAPFLVLGIIGSTVPRFGTMSLAFVIFFITQMGLANQMAYNAVSFFNFALAFALGAGAAVITFRVLLPPNPDLDATRLARAVRRACQRMIAGRGPRDDLLGWQVVQNQRLQRLFMRLQGRPDLRARIITSSGALLMITQEAVRLRCLLPALALPGAARADAAAALGRIARLRSPDAQQSALRAAEALAALHDASPEAAPALMRAAGGFHAIALLIPQAEGLAVLAGPGMAA